jgi:rhodanese-related sulfurtransferase
MKLITRKNWAPIGIGLLIFSVFWSSCDTLQPETLSVSPETLRAELLEDEFNFPPSEALQKAASGELILIDIRPAISFEKGHLEKAVNIPLEYLLDKEAKERWEDESITKVLYGENYTDGSAAWMLLRQLGYENIRVLPTTFNSLMTWATLGPEEQSEAINNCAPHYDFQTLFAKAQKEDELEEEASRPQPTRVIAQPAAKKVTPAKKKAAPAPAPEEEEEGC